MTPEAIARRLVLALQSADYDEAASLGTDLASAYGWDTCDECGSVLDGDGQCPDGHAQTLQCSCDGTCPSCRASEREARRAARRMADADVG